ncbi:MAG: hypothetical protein KUF79_17330 [Candidatus Thiodiazotropha sp. (ex Ctena orbiculata)]|nr:hypothetical protein [Candidatus Thiodiazotropha taylori]
MSVFNKFQNFIGRLGLAEHQLNTHTFRAALTNVAPVAAQTDFDPVTNHAAPAAANGYTAGGYDIQNGYSEAGGIGTMSAVDVVVTAAGGQIGPFRYVVVYNDDHASDGLCSYFDYGSSITLNDGESFTIDFTDFLTLQ